jgi:hypothetical protein
MRLEKYLLMVLLLASAVSLAGCRGLPNGPTLSDVALNDINLNPTIGNPDLCCCRVVGTATNNNTAAVHVSITFSSFDANSKQISSIFFFIQDLQPNTTAPIDAPGFVYPCSNIKRLETSVHVSGIALPPV